MRAIKFRAWTGKELLPVYDLNCQDGDTVLFEGETVHMIKNEDLTLMQYTGLKDKNDVEIYEGDIIRYKSCNDFWPGPDEKEEIITEVTFDKHGAWGLGESYEGGPEGKIWTEDIEVIGNIYENKELLT